MADEEGFASIVDNLYSVMEVLYEVNQELIPESELKKIALATAVLMVIITRLTGDSEKDIHQHFKRWKKEREKKLRTN